MPAPNVNMDSAYPYGADNGEQIWQDSGPATLQYAPINIAANGPVIAGVAGKKIRVLGYLLTALAAGTVEFQTQTGTAAISGPMNVAANGQINVPPSKFGCFETLVGDGLYMAQTGTSQQISGHLVYVTH